MMRTINSYNGMSAVDAVTAAFDAAEENQQVHALLHLTKERALARAKAVDEGTITGKLAGVPFVVKDNFLTYDGPTTAASTMLQDFMAPLQATAVERLEAEGAICIGKTNLDAFAHGGSTENSAFGPTKNAIDETRVAGGSSGGSAVAVARGIVPFALGTDTGGSIRQPASFNGVVGVKPTYGTVSRYGVVAMASGTDTIGCFASTIDDAERVMSVMAGPDTKDMTTLPESWQAPSSSQSTKRIGLIKQFMDEGVDDSVRRVILDYKARLEAAGHVVEEVDIPMVKYSLAMYYIIVPAEISSNLARYDGIRYGRRAAEASTLADVYGMSRDQGFESENKRRIMIGSYVLSSGYFDAFYNQAQKARTLLIKEFETIFNDYDYLLGPVAPTPAFKLGDRANDPVTMYLSDVMTVPASLAGLPAMSVPAGNDEDGLPINAQLIGPVGSDTALLQLAREAEGSDRG